MRGCGSAAAALSAASRTAAPPAAPTCLSPLVFSPRAHARAHEPRDRSAGLSEEEKAARLEAAKQARVSAVLAALAELAGRSAVSKERAMFVDLVGTEIGRLHESLSKQGSSLVFTGKARLGF